MNGEYVVGNSLKLLMNRVYGSQSEYVVKSDQRLRERTSQTVGKFPAAFGGGGRGGGGGLEGGLIKEGVYSFEELRRWRKRPQIE